MSCGLLSLLGARPPYFMSVGACKPQIVCDRNR